MTEHNDDQDDVAATPPVDETGLPLGPAARRAAVVAQFDDFKAQLEALAAPAARPAGGDA